MKQKLYESIFELNWDDYGSWINPVLDEIIEIKKPGGHIQTGTEWLLAHNKKVGVGAGQLYANMIKNNWIRVVYEKHRKSKESNATGELNVCGSKENIREILPVLIKTLKKNNIALFRFEDFDNMYNGSTFDVSSGNAAFGNLIRFFM